jgi:hypothetical protein
MLPFPAVRSFGTRSVGFSAFATIVATFPFNRQALGGIGVVTMNEMYSQTRTGRILLDLALRAWHL